MESYTPKPIDTSAVHLPDEVLEVRELLAHNTHETWAAQRIAEGWQWGKARDDEKKLHPCLVPYEELSESEKEYDRNTATESLKLIVALGFEIRKKKE